MNTKSKGISGLRKHVRTKNVFLMPMKTTIEKVGLKDDPLKQREMLLNRNPRHPPFPGLHCAVAEAAPRGRDFVFLQLADII